MERRGGRGAAAGVRQRTAAGTATRHSQRDKLREVGHASNHLAGICKVAVELASVQTACRAAHSKPTTKPKTRRVARRCGEVAC